MPTVENVIDMRYTTSDNTVIDCKVKFAELPGYVPFAATSYDSAPYGVQIYNDCVAGRYGPITPFQPKE